LVGGSAYDDDRKTIVILADRGPMPGPAWRSDGKLPVASESHSTGSGGFVRWGYGRGIAEDYRLVIRLRLVGEG